MLKNLLVVGALLVGKMAFIGLTPPPQTTPKATDDADCPWCPTPECFPGECDC